MSLKCASLALLVIWLRNVLGQHIEARQYVRGLADDDAALSFCFGYSSICSIGNDLYAACEKYDDFNNLGPFYQCICSNGYVTVED
jgi:hypothetical protein